MVGLLVSAGMLLFMMSLLSAQKSAEERDWRAGGRKRGGKELVKGGGESRGGKGRSGGKGEEGRGLKERGDE